MVLHQLLAWTRGQRPGPQDTLRRLSTSRRDAVPWHAEAAMPHITAVSTSYPHDAVDAARRQERARRAQIRATANAPLRSQAQDQERQRVERHKGTLVDRRA